MVAGTLPNNSTTMTATDHQAFYATRIFHRPFLKYFLLLPLLLAFIYLFCPVFQVQQEIFLRSLQRTTNESTETSNSSEFSCFGEDARRVKKSVEKSEEVYQTYVEKRRALVKGRPDKINPWKPHTYMYDYFLATFACPFSTERIGKLGDGGKWVCGMELLEQKSSCVIYSFGIGGETTFEREMLARTRCELFGYDGSIDEVVRIPTDYQKRLHFFKLFGGREVNNKYTTIGEAMRRNGHKKIDLLKIDAEGAEFNMLPQVIEEFGDKLPFTQLLLEIHGQSNGLEYQHKFFEMLENAGLRPFRNELNLVEFVMGRKNSALSEYSFLYVRQMC